MVLVALDHVRDFLSDSRFDPLDLSRPTAGLFLTRWLTHFLDGLDLLNAEADRRRTRRELTVAELGRLLTTSRASGGRSAGSTARPGFTSTRRLAERASGPGVRHPDAGVLQPGRSFPVVQLPVRGDKSKHGKIQPLPADVAELLRSWLAGKPAGRPLWPGTWAEDRRAAEMLRRDLAAAGVPYTVQGPDGPMHADFHALRHTSLTLGGRAGIDLRTLQELAGHSTPILTARYTHVRLHDQAEVVERLPGFVPKQERESAGSHAGNGRETGEQARRNPLASPTLSPREAGLWIWMSGVRIPSLTLTQSQNRI
jgi:integrase